MNRIETLVKSQFPQFYREEGPRFIAFLEAYYEYVDANLNTRSLRAMGSIDTAPEEFIDHFLNTFLPSVPRDAIANKRLLVKYITRFNQSRGTAAAYRFLFRALYGDIAEIEFPSNQILKASDTDWTQDTYLVASQDDRLNALVGKEIRGTVSGATAVVESVVTKVVSGRNIAHLNLSSIVGNFTSDDLVTDRHTTGPMFPIDGDVVRSAGKYNSDRGIIGSRYAILQDNRYYQEFSYVILSSIPFDRYRDIIYELAHPAGQAVFGKLRMKTTLPVGINSDGALTRYDLTRLIRTRVKGPGGVRGNTAFSIQLRLDDPSSSGYVRGDWRSITIRPPSGARFPRNGIRLNDPIFVQGGNGEMVRIRLGNLVSALDPSIMTTVDRIPISIGGVATTGDDVFLDYYYDRFEWTKIDD